MPCYDQLHAFGAHQYGLVTFPQLVDCGFSRQAIGRMYRAGKVERVRPGVYRLCGMPFTWRSTALAAVLAARAGVRGDNGGPTETVLSHRSAGALWGLVDPHQLDFIEITQPQPCRLPGIVTHRHPLRPADRTVYQRIPVTTAERTLIDLAVTHDAGSMGELVDQALRRRLTSVRKLRSALDRVAVAPRTGRVRTTMAAVLSTRGVDYDPGANPWEREMDRWFDQSGLPPARRQYRVQVDGHRYRLDRAIPELRVAIEWTGRESHGTRSQFEYDSDRRSRLQAAGWRVLDFHYRSDPAFIIRTVQAVCEDQSQLLHPAAPR